MAGDGLRRSGRVRNAVKSYAEEQADESLGPIKPTKQRKRKAESDEEDFDQAEIETPPKKAAMKVVKIEAKIQSPPRRTKMGIVKEVRSMIPDSPATAARKAANAKSYYSKSNGSMSHQDAAERRIAINSRTIKPLKPGEEETRLRRHVPPVPVLCSELTFLSYVDEAPDSYHGALERATSQRMFVLERQRGVEEACHAHHDDCPQEILNIAGSTGNVYTVTISHLPSCTCPVGVFTKKGNETLCKHILYVLHNVFKAAEELKQQNAFLTSELKDLFANAPALPSAPSDDDEPMDGNRKPVEDDCPICCMEFEDNDDIVWCRAACGNNVHKACFAQWAKTKPGRVTCPFCRSEWEDEKAGKHKVNVAAVNIPTERGAGGYRNVRDQLDYD